MKFPGILPKNGIVKLFYINEPLKFLHVLSSNHKIGREWLVFHPSFSYDLICQYFGENQRPHDQQHDAKSTQTTKNQRKNQNLPHEFP